MNKVNRLLATLGYPTVILNGNKEINTDRVKTKMGKKISQFWGPISGENGKGLLIIEFHGDYDAVYRVERYTFLTDEQYAHAGEVCQLK